MNEVRTRFAPSPTGYMHVGNLRTALYAYLLAKSLNGKFILRIEDTDQERLVPGAVDVIYKTLKATGLVWDEGPDIGGDFGPYVQSERMDIYAKYAKQLVESGHAYYCFCDKARLEEMRMLQKFSGELSKYDGFCRHLTPEQVEEKLKAGMPYVIRQKIPESGQTTFEDEVFGNITVENSSLDDQVLIKADGMPTYNLANVIDDHLMGITHVIRGNEYLSSAPKYNLLYEAFGWEIPKYIHCSPVMKNQSEKLSKRNGDASFEDLVQKGYLEPAIINYIALLGWSPKSEQEIFSLDNLVHEFKISGISKSPAIFDIKKLNYINSHYIKQLSPAEFLTKAKPFIQQTVKRADVDFELIASTLQTRTEFLSDIPQQVDFIDSLPDYSTDLFISKKMKTTKESSLTVLIDVLPIFKDINDYSVPNLHNILMQYIEKCGAKNGFVLWPIRTALSGKQFTPGGAIELAAILGKNDVAKRIELAINKLKNDI
ncbi:MAG: glutamate--tRNA ligase [Oscillospiraceae bacterium]|nr:glutamate--tRNA ligase [Oscillospiraceae bacterium]